MKRAKRDTPLYLMYPWANLPMGKLFHRAKKWDEKVGFSSDKRKQLEVFPTWNSVYESTIYPLMVIYSNLLGNLDIPQNFQVPICDAWPTWSWQQKLGKQTKGIRKGSMKLSEEEKDILDSMHSKWGLKGRTPLKTKHHSTPSSNVSQII